MSNMLHMSLSLQKAQLVSTADKTKSQIKACKLKICAKHYDTVLHALYSKLDLIAKLCLIYNPVYNLCKINEDSMKNHTCNEKG
jgi:hypothetical protein